MEQEIKTLNDLIALGLGDCELRINGKPIKDCDITKYSIYKQALDPHGQAIDFKENIPTSFKRNEYIDICSYEKRKVILNDCT